MNGSLSLSLSFLRFLPLAAGSADAVAFAFAFPLACGADALALGAALALEAAFAAAFLSNTDVMTSMTSVENLFLKSANVFARLAGDVPRERSSAPLTSAALALGMNILAMAAC